VPPTEPYPNDSLRWVAAEVRYPQSAELAEAVPVAFRDHLHDQFPIFQEEPQVVLAFPGNPLQPVLRRRFLSRDRLLSVTVSRDLVTLEGTEYPGWTIFSRTFMDALRALAGAARPDGIARVALRYIDEIRIPNVPATPAGWSGWIAEELIAPFRLYDPERLTSGAAVVQYGTPPGFVIVFRASPLASGRTVMQQGALRMPVDTPDGPYFLIDSIAAWTDPEGQIPEFDPERISGLLDDLHRPCREFFEAAITDRLRDEVFNRPRGAVGA
jgi:uncharacterized protein (TIGR04255 family)